MSTNNLDPNISGGGPQHQPEIDPAQESLNNAMRSAFRVLGVVMIVLVLLYLGSGLFQVNTGESGLIARFGELRVNTATGTRVFEQGLHTALPDPFDEKIRIPGEVQSLVIDSFCFQRRTEDLNKPLADSRGGERLTTGVDGAMLTGDKNLSHGLWTIQYRVTDAEGLVTNVGDTVEAVRPILQRLGETAILRTVSSKMIEDVLLRRQTEVALEVQKRLQDEINALSLGVEIVKIAPELIEPRPVRQAFVNVTLAEGERESRINEAHAKETEILTKKAGQNYTVLLELIGKFGEAQALGASDAELAELSARIDEELDGAGGEVAVMLREARSEATGTREQISREYEEFKYYLEQYRKHPRITTLRMWVSLLHSTLASKDNEVFFVPSAGEIEIVINRDPVLQIQRERERVSREMGGPR